MGYVRDNIYVINMPIMNISDILEILGIVLLVIIIIKAILDKKWNLSENLYKLK